MQLFNLLIATPEATLFHANVKMAIFPGADGIFEILPQHAPLMAMVKAGTVEITDSTGTKHSISIREGFFEFHQNSGVLLNVVG